MRKIIGIIFISLMFANIGFADIKMSEYKAFKDSLYEADGLVIQVFCVGGYKFVSTERSDTVLNGTSVTMSMVQAFEERDGKSLPTKCWKF